jgi:tripartite-type tricarboxylate transporter receptor subunit TctC
MCSSTLPSQLPHIRAGSIRPLAVTTVKRIKELPETPTLIELGYDIKMVVWHGLFAPKGTPKEIIDKIYGSIKTMYDRNKKRSIRD